MAERISPLAGWSSRLGSIGVRELPFLTQLNLRAAPSASLAGVLGVALPLPCMWARGSVADVLWLGPDEWLIVTDSPDGLGDALRTAGGSVTDVSAQRTTLSLTGPGARELLAHGCAIDFHPGVSATGYCVQTLLAQTGVIITVGDDTATDFRLFVRASFAAYLAAWLIDAAG